MHRTLKVTSDDCQRKGQCDILGPGIRKQRKSTSGSVTYNRVPGSPGHRTRQIETTCWTSNECHMKTLQVFQLDTDHHFAFMCSSDGWIRQTSYQSSSLKVEHRAETTLLQHTLLVAVFFISFQVVPCFFITWLLISKFFFGLSGFRFSSELHSRASWHWWVVSIAPKYWKACQNHRARFL